MEIGHTKTFSRVRISPNLRIFAFRNPGRSEACLPGGRIVHIQKVCKMENPTHFQGLSPEEANPSRKDLHLGTAA